MSVVPNNVLDRLRGGDPASLVGLSLEKANA
jgi:hypothetical protein